MGQSRCCVEMCNNPSGNGISLHTFPKADILKSKWVCAIQLAGLECSRARWSGPRNNNSQLVCSQYFEMFTLTTRTKWQLGISSWAVLNVDAITTLFGRNVRMSNIEPASPSRRVIHKREIQKVRKYLLIFYFFLNYNTIMSRQEGIHYM